MTTFKKHLVTFSPHSIINATHSKHLQKISDMLFEKESPRDGKLFCKHHMQLGVCKLFKRSNEKEGKKRNKAPISMHSHSLWIYLSVLVIQRHSYTMPVLGAVANRLEYQSVTVTDMKKTGIENHMGSSVNFREARFSTVVFPHVRGFQDMLNFWICCWTFSNFATVQV